LAALCAEGDLAEVVTDHAATLPAAVDEVMRGAFHNTEPYANSQIEAEPLL
jgi:hypothetical protein